MRFWELQCAVSGFLFGRTSISQSISVTGCADTSWSLSATRLADCWLRRRSHVHATFGEPDMVHLEWHEFREAWSASSEGARRLPKRGSSTFDYTSYGSFAINCIVKSFRGQRFGEGVGEAPNIPPRRDWFGYTLFPDDYWVISFC